MYQAAIARARRTWSTTASGCRRRSTTGRCASTSSRSCCRRRFSCRPRRPTTRTTHAGQVVEQLVRPTGLVDPVLEVRPAQTQVDDLLSEINLRVDQERARAGHHADQAHGRGPDRLPERARGQGALPALGHRHRRAGRRSSATCGLGEFDVLVGINLLREGLDIPEVSLVAHPRRRQGRLPARRTLADPDDRPRFAAHQRHGDPLRRQDDRLDEGRDRRDDAAPQQAAGVEREDGHHADRA